LITYETVLPQWYIAKSTLQIRELLDKRFLHNYSRYIFGLIQFKLIYW